MAMTTQDFAVKRKNTNRGEGNIVQVDKPGRVWAAPVTCWWWTESGC